MFAVALQPDGKVLLLGSHLDTVRDAGKFDGPLGVLVAIQFVNAVGASRGFAIGEVQGMARIPLLRRLGQIERAPQVRVGGPGREDL